MKVLLLNDNQVWLRKIQREWDLIWSVIRYYFKYISFDEMKIRCRTTAKWSHFSLQRNFKVLQGNILNVKVKLGKVIMLNLMINSFQNKF